MGYVETTSIVVRDIYIVAPYGINIYEIRGEELPYCSTHITKHHNTIYKTEDLTQEQLRLAFPSSAYITESFYAKISAFQKRAIKDKVIGIIQDNYYYHYYWKDDPYGGSIYCFAQKADASIRPFPPLAVCEGIVCDNRCDGHDLWSMECVNDVCIDSTIIEENSATCGYIDPCEGVVCEPTCIDYDLWSQKCVDGLCAKEEMLEQNSSDCGYVPPDPCEGVVCDPSCTGYDLWTQKCVDGLCINDIMLEQNSPTCEYVPPDEHEWYDPIVDNCGYILLLIAAGVTIDHVT